MYILYGKPNCPNCETAKTILTQKDIEYKYVDVSEDFDSLQMLKIMGIKSVPQLFLDEQHVGDFVVIKNNL